MKQKDIVGVIITCEQIILNPNKMNVFLPFRYLIVLLVLSLMPLVVQSQIEYHDVLVNDSLFYTFESVGNAAQVELAPMHGDFILNDGPLNYPLGTTGENNLVYIPDQDYTGPDLIKIFYWADGNTGPVQNILTLVLNVVDSYVLAVNDYVSTSPNTTVTIDVLSNDEGNNTLVVADVPLTNHGTSEIEGNSILFTPKLDFEGIANLNYTVCNDTYEKCDVATITVFVQPDDALVDTTTITTLKNREVRALFPTSDGIQELVSPQNGTVDTVDGGASYIPHLDFTGKDTFTFAYNTDTNLSLETFIIDVKWAADPTVLVVNDYGYSAINDTAVLNVLDNDQNDDLSIMSFTPTSDEGGEVIHNGNGDFEYIPPTGFNGIDFFEYTANIPGTSAEEDGMVYIIVNNQKPAAFHYDLYTAENTPLVLDYDIPISGFDFTIIEQGQHGELIYYEGYDTITVNNQTVEGYNLLVYYPNSNFLGSDLVSVQYCVDTDCKTVSIDVTVQAIDAPQGDTLCVTDCVWPGDANGDGVVNMTDLLPLGYHIGEMGPERENGNTEWYGQYSDDWDGSIASNGNNIKHIDVNGDGYISAQDTSIIIKSYGKYNNLTPQPQPVATEIPLFFVPQTPNPAPGDLVIIDIVLGTENLPAKDVHGITFALNFNEDIVEPGTMKVDYRTHSWFSYESAMISMMKEPLPGRVESGYTRATGISKHGYGIVGQVSFIVVDDIIDGNRLKDTLVRTFRPEELISLNAAGQYFKLVSENFNLRIAHDIKETLVNNNSDLITYPNPTTGELNIHINGNNELEQIIVPSITGQEVFRTHDELYGKQTTISLNNRITNGIYLVTAICNKGVYTQKIELVR